MADLAAPPIAPLLPLCSMEGEIDGLNTGVDLTGARLKDSLSGAYIDRRKLTVTGKATPLHPGNINDERHEVLQYSVGREPCLNGCTAKTNVCVAVSIDCAAQSE